MTPDPASAAGGPPIRMPAALFRQNDFSFQLLSLSDSTLDKWDAHPSTPRRVGHPRFTQLALQFPAPAWRNRTGAAARPRPPAGFAPGLLPCSTHAGTPP